VTFLCALLWWISQSVIDSERPWWLMPPPPNEFELPFVISSPCSFTLAWPGEM